MANPTLNNLLFTLNFQSMTMVDDSLEQMLVHLATLLDSPLCAEHNDTKLTHLGSVLAAK
jgi:hypothetical protein